MTKTNKMFSTKSLQYFLQLIDTMNYTQAAQILGITQPALTQQIKKLERAIGTPLFGQVGKKLYLTEAGKELQTGAIKLLDTVNSVVDSIQEFTQLDKGVVSIGILETIPYLILQKFLIGFNKKYPDITIKVRSFSHGNLWHELDNNLIDLAFMYLPDNSKKTSVDLQQQYDHIDLYEDRAVILTHNSSMKAGQTYSGKNFFNQDWVSYPDENYLCQVVKESIDGNSELHAPIQFSETDKLITAAQETNYDTFISNHYYQVHQKEITLTPVYLENSKSFSASLTYRKSKMEIPRIKNFITELINFLDKKNY